MNLDDSLEHIINPTNFVKNFTDMEHFKRFCRQGIINDCKAMLKVYEKYELYEHCAAIQFVIDEKVDLMLSGFGFDVD